MLVPNGSFSTEIEVRKSRFIATAFFCDSFEYLKKVIAQTRNDNPSARHVVHAAVIGTQFSMSDDHEPKNTAGRPALEVLKGSGISNIGLTITRYFGGTLLGTGGLVRAYTDSAKAALEGLKVEEFVNRISFSVEVPYELLQSTKRILEKYEATDTKETFTDIVIIHTSVPDSCKDLLQHDFSEISNGKIQLVWC
ncbi:MAG: YigZ family protein [Sphaerochaetaceae bacterium]|jgi:uncharacterized YigZ family protein|nr:YigZ family protein [Sphaerochaetaceae bacterium]NLY06924.1 hypothetical protein [Spirochaetales bacterium]